jgi:hypothetical protein
MNGNQTYSLGAYLLDETGTTLRTLAQIVADFIIVVSDGLRNISENIMKMDWVAIQQSIVNIITSIIGLIMGGIGMVINLVISTMDALIKTSMGVAAGVGKEISVAGVGVGSKAVPR